MTPRRDRANPGPSPEARRAVWKQASAASAVVAVAFSLIVLAMLARAAAGWVRNDPRDSRELAALQQSLADRPDNGVKTRIRELDHRLRAEYLRKRDFVSSGFYLLIGGVAAFFVALHLRRRLQPHRPSPPARRDESRRALFASAVARWSVAGVGAVLLGCLATLVVLSPPAPVVALTGEENGPVGDVPEGYAENWPVFRGPAYGVARGDFPASWDAKTGRNILWKTPAPLPGNNSPVVWGERVFLTGANPRERAVYCFDAATGRVLWSRPVNVPGTPPEPPQVLDDLTGYAAPTAAVDGRRVYAIFANGNIAAFDFAGRQVWARNLGVPENSYGHASSLAIHRNLVIVQMDQSAEGKSALLALDTRTGRTVWSVSRPVGGSWSSPIVIPAGQRRQIITCGNPFVIAYDADTAHELWRADCLGADTAPTPAFTDGLVYAATKMGKLSAIRADGTGNVTDTRVVWASGDNLPDTCSPLTDGRTLWTLASEGMFTAYEAKGGKKLYEHELEASFQASPTLAGGKLFLPSIKGVMFILSAGQRFELLGQVELGEECSASPAFVSGRIYIRGHQNLYCIQEKSQAGK